jgi:epoxyqueuosine reductase
VKFDEDLAPQEDVIVSATRVKIERIEIFKRWVSMGFHATMTYLSKDDAFLKREDTSLLSQDSKSILVFLLNYKHKIASGEGYGMIASYASFKDYHIFFPEMINRFMVENQLFIKEFKTFVDTGPVTERGIAEQSSLGWIGRNSMLINSRMGSFTFIGGAVTDMVLDEIHFPSPDLCGRCTRCIDNCPTGAINMDRTVDSNLCISYHTIENRDVIPRVISEKMGNMIFGCDICNDVCPWNRGKRESTLPVVQEDLFSSRMRLEDIAYLDKEQFDKQFRGSAIKRATFEGLARNALIALHNSGEDHLVREVAREFSDLRRRQAALLMGEI